LKNVLSVGTEKSDFELLNSEREANASM